MSRQIATILLLFLVAFATPPSSIADFVSPQGEAQLLDQYYLHLFGGQGTAPDPDGAMAILTKAADQGFPRAQALLGLCYRFGRFVKADARLARQWLERAARNGNRDAQYHLGLLLVEGSGTTTENLQQTYVWWTVAANGGDLLAKEALKELDYRLSNEEKAVARQRYADLFALTAAPPAIQEDEVATAAVSPLPKQQTDAVGSIDLRDVSARWVTNRAAGNLFVLQGYAFNNYPVARLRMRVQAALRGSQGQVLVEQAVYCGKVLSVSKLSEMTVHEIQLLNQPLMHDQAEPNIAPGQSSPFTIVFRNVPPNVVQYTLTGDSQAAPTR